MEGSKLTWKKERKNKTILKDDEGKKPSYGYLSLPSS